MSRLNIKICQLIREVRSPPCDFTVVHLMPATAAKEIRDTEYLLITNETIDNWLEALG